jgi:hypothetical protein
MLTRRAPDGPFMEDDAMMSLLLGPIGTTMAIGREKRIRTTTIADGSIAVDVLRSPHGSTRYLASIDERAVAVLQVVSMDGRHASVANVLTVSEHRRRGIASMLLAEARGDFATVVHSDMLSKSGRGFAEATR